MKNAFLRSCFAVGRFFSGQNKSEAPAATTSQPQVSSGRSLVIASHVMRFSPDSGRYALENGVRDCLNEIAKTEGWPTKAPNSEYLYRWEARKEIPSQYKELS